MAPVLRDFQNELPSFIATFLSILKAIREEFVELWNSIDWEKAHAKLQWIWARTLETIADADLLSTQKLVGYGLFIYGLLVVSKFDFLAFPPALLVYATLVILLAIVGFAIQIIVVLVLLLIGFASAGIRSGSLASGFQSSNYGATIPAGSTFSRMQSAGARSGSGLGYGDASFSVDVRSLSIVIGFVSCAAGICLVVNDLLYPA